MPSTLDTGDIEAATFKVKEYISEEESQSANQFLNPEAPASITSNRQVMVPPWDMPSGPWAK